MPIATARLRKITGMGLSCASASYRAAHVVADVVDAINDVWLRLAVQPRLVRDFLVFALDHIVTAEAVDRGALRDCHEPSAWIARNARLRPLRKRRNKGILREFFGKSDVTHHPRQSGDDFGRLDAPQSINGAVRIEHDSITQLRVFRELVQLRKPVTGDFEKALCPLQRFIPRRDGQHRVAPDDLFRFGERTVRYGDLRSVLSNAEFRSARVDAAEFQQGAGVSHLPNELSHCRHHRFIGLRLVNAAIDRINRHEFHVAVFLDAIDSR